MKKVLLALSPDLHFLVPKAFADRYFLGIAETVIDSGPLVVSNCLNEQANPLQTKTRPSSD